MKSSSKLPMELSDACTTAQHSSNTMESLRRDEQHCDAVIEAGGEKFKIHKSVFAIYSDFLDKAFTVEMQEKYSNVVKVENIRADVMQCIVDFVYTGQLSINRENVVDLLVAADYLGIKKIKELSTKYLFSNLDAENCVSVWTCAWTYNNEELLDKSLMVFASNMLSVPHEELDGLTNDQFIEIMESTKGMRTSEEASFTLLATWVKCDLEKRKTTFRKMIQTFELSLFSEDFLISIAGDEKLLLISWELPQKIVMEVVSRTEKRCQKYEELEKPDQGTTGKVNRSKTEKRRLAKRFQEKKLKEENKRLADLAKTGTNEFTESDMRQQKLLKKKNDELTDENKKLIDENQNLKRRLQERENRIEQDKQQQQGLNRKIIQIGEANQTLDMENMLMLVNIHGFVKDVRYVLNNSAIPSLFWPGIYLRNDDKDIIENCLNMLGGFSYNGNSHMHP